MLLLMGFNEREIFGYPKKTNCQIFVYVITFGLMVQFMDSELLYLFPFLSPHSLTKWHRLKYKTEWKGIKLRVERESVFHHNRGSLIFQHKRKNEREKSEKGWMGVVVRQICYWNLLWTSSSEMGKSNKERRVREVKQILNK